MKASRRRIFICISQSHCWSLLCVMVWVSSVGLRVPGSRHSSHRGTLTSLSPSSSHTWRGELNCRYMQRRAVDERMLRIFGFSLIRRTGAGRLDGRAHTLLEARDLDARVLGVSPHGRGGDRSAACGACSVSAS